MCAALSLVAGANLGCRGMFGGQGIPEDPLFVSRKPVEAKAELKPPELVAYAEPAMPIDPIVIARDRQLGGVPAILTGRPSKSVLTPPRQLP